MTQPTTDTQAQADLLWLAGQMTDCPCLNAHFATLSNPNSEKLCITCDCREHHSEGCLNCTRGSGSVPLVPWARRRCDCSCHETDIPSVNSHCWFGAGGRYCYKCTNDQRGRHGWRPVPLPEAATAAREAVAEIPFIGFQLVKLHTSKEWKCAIFEQGYFKYFAEALDPDAATIAAYRKYVEGQK